MSGVFYIVATPIGNLSDITFRAVEILRSVDAIACEDTRVTKVLASKYDISAKLFDCHKFNEMERSKKIISMLEEGKNIALVSDAGTPGISDPGGVLVRELRERNIKITSIPGCCAVSVFLSMVNRDSEEFAFIGFIPRTEGDKKAILNKYKYTNCVFYESPERLLNTLDFISKLYGADKKTAVGRELTKVFEEVKIGSVSDIIDYYSSHTLKGEIVVMVYAENNRDFNENDIKEKINILKSEGFSSKDIIKIMTKLFGLKKNCIYDMVSNCDDISG